MPANGSRLLAIAAEFEKAGSGWFWETDARGNIAYLTGEIAELFGKSPDMLAYCAFQSLFLTEQGGDGAAPRNLSLLFGGRKTFAGLTVRAAIDDSEIYWVLSGRPQFDSAGEFLGYRGSAADVSESRKAENETSRLAEFDSLTGLSNRYRMQRKIDAMLTAFRAAKRACAVMMIDLDRFKTVNDTFGHKAGDELLKQVSARIKRVFDGTAEIGRIGGDEFQVLLPDWDDRGRLGEIARKVIAMVTQPFQLEEGRCMIGASVGIAIAPYDGVTCEEIVHSADIALYAAKNGGRGQFRFYSSELQSESHLRKELAHDLREALEAGQLRLEYQPVVSASSNEVVAMEALLRWYHPERGKIPPDVFIPIAEESNLILRIGEWVIRTACEDAANWPEQVRVCINLSEQQLIAEGLAHLVANAIAQAGIQPDRVEMELRESIHFSEGDATERELNAMRRLGVRLSLDDFGTGASSLGYLRRAPFETIKIDPSFLRGAMREDSRNPELIGALVALARALGMQTVAEGVEAMDELALVREKGVDLVQGFAYSPPIAADEVDEFLADKGWTIEPNGPEKQRSERRKLYQKIHVIHEDHLYDVILRDLSRTGAMIQGLLDVPVGTQFVVDFGEGQLAIAKVLRSHQDQQGVEFEHELVEDGAGGLVTRNRVSPYALAAAGMPLAQLPPGQYPLAEKAGDQKMLTMPRFGVRNLKAKLEY
ncbi:MAG: EAL domain-containing protein [Candidatus Andeanibacterium colombiense]|uniref:EAL domain-containing protein n=1 Tax=Candidatus Andeanibacterium colombiense TaxID=3121345 RepID=A0AAJ5X7A0_9SPHN|nr:MAG: EAL domain-containing protein [Sphingomonadaceae bacterium]